MGLFFCWSASNMPRSNGYRCNTRDLFSRPFRQHGMPSLQTYMTTFKIGDYVDVVANSAIQKGMPHKFYHGRTGVVWSVTPRAVGVEINKQVGNRIMKKRIYVRIEHVQKSKCRRCGNQQAGRKPHHEEANLRSHRACAKVQVP